MLLGSWEQRGEPVRDLTELLSLANSSEGNSSSYFVTAAAKSRKSLVNLRQQLNFMFALNFYTSGISELIGAFLKGNFFPLLKKVVCVESLEVRRLSQVSRRTRLAIL